MADVIYVHPHPYGDGVGVGPATYPVLPVGLVGLINLLRADGFSVAGVNLPVTRGADPGFDLERWLEAHASASLLLIDLHWYEHALGALEVARRAKAALPHVLVVLGGLTATHFAPAILAAAPEVDAVVAGDAEEPVRLLAHAAREGRPPHDLPNVWVRGGSEPVPPQARYRTPPETIEAQDSVDLSWLLHADVYRRLSYSFPRRGMPMPVGRRAQWLGTGRGCAFLCSYCGGGRAAHEELGGLRGLLKRSPEAIALDAQRLASLGVDQIAPSLDPDMFGRRHLEALVGRLARVSPRPGYYVESYQLPSRALLDGLAKVADLAHTELALTPLSGDLSVRRLNGKLYDDEALLDTLRALAARDLSVFLFFSLNLPGEDDRTLAATVDLVERCIDLVGPERLRAINIGHTLDPVSPMLRDPATFGIDEITLRSFADYLDYGRRQGSGRPWSFEEAPRGFVVRGRDLAAMAARWDGLAARHPGVVVPVPRY
jgi:hypothetical protein